MSKELDIALEELDNISKELEVMSHEFENMVDYCENLNATITVICERLAMISHPNFLALPDGERHRIVENLSSYYRNMDKSYVRKH